MERELHYRPGDQVRWFAQKQGWPISRLNIIVEGDNDKKYFELAATLYYSKHNRQLFGPHLSIFPTGSGDKGGTDGIQLYFPAFRIMIDSDITPDGKRAFHAVTLLDSDSAGKYAFRALTSRVTSFKANRDIFLLHRIMPRTTLEPNALTSQISQMNDQWGALDCEIEDLISLELLQAFVQERPKSLKKDPVIKNGAHHFEFTGDGKAALFRYVEQHAILNDVLQIAEVLKSFRYYLGLNPEGE